MKRFIGTLCYERNILVNNITSKTEMNCRFGSIIDNEEYILGISAKGNPKRAKEMREKLEVFFYMKNNKTYISILY